MNLQNPKPRRPGRGRGQNSRTQESVSNPDTFNDWLNSNRNANMRENLCSDKPPENGGSSKFEKACTQMQNSVKQFAQFDNQYESSDEEENENQEAILQQIMASYLNHSGDGKMNTNDFSRTHRFILESFKSGSSVCLVCIATIKKTEPIWSCKSCYGIFHIPCIQKWAKESIFHQVQSLPDDQPVQTKNITWFCPKCRHEYTQSEKPTKYFCFCGKDMDPKFDAWLVPHSCGNTCGKPLTPNCGHFCNVLCHPGPCPPCPQTIKVSCYCARKPAQLKRCSARGWSCGQLCNRVLSCGQHKCQQFCHSDECAVCEKRSIQKCYCGKEKEERSCTEATWKCNNICGRDLECGNHKCEIVCHSGECDPCPKSGERTCPCGKTKHKLPCTEDVPSCGDTCNKPLECNQHYCAKRCHTGPCGNCLQMSNKRCVCGHREKFLPCHKEFRCDTKCKKMRDCGRHPCNKKCCSGQCPLCEQICNRTLTCRNHKCSSQCHQGPCYPCPLSVDIKCNCSSTVITVPCGRERATKPPKCTQLCKNSPDCHHKSRTKHNCHFGPCPPCKQICQKKLTNCKHSCPVPCHSAVVVKVQNKKKREGPWEPKPEAKIEVVNRACPPCKVPTSVTCIGLHETTDFACSDAKPFSCLRECGRKLTCNNHNCSKTCHEVLNAENNNLAGSNCEVCEKPCSKPRPDGCPHACLSICHSNECVACKQMIKLRCHCLLNVIFVECHKLTSAEGKEKIELTSCKNQCPKTISCGHRCPQNCHPGMCIVTNNCKKKVSLRCPCKRVKKDVVCHMSKKTKVDCDEKCVELKNAELKAKEEEEKRKLEEEKKKEEAELQKYQLKMEGKKRKQRKAIEISENRSIFQSFAFQLFVCLSAVAIAATAIYLLY